MQKRKKLSCAQKRKKDRERKRKERQTLRERRNEDKELTRDTSGKCKFSNSELASDEKDNDTEHIKKRHCPIDIRHHCTIESQSACVSSELVASEWCSGSVFATFDQGSNIFSPSSRGRQCTCISLVMLTQARSNIEFTKDFLDWILIEGDFLYRHTIQSLNESGNFKHNFLLFEELPTSVIVNDQKYLIGKMDVITGVVLHEMYLDCYTLEEGIYELCEYAESGLLMVNGLCSAVFKYRRHFWFFDSHSHDANGMSCADGKAILVQFDSVSNLVAYLYQYYASANSLGTTQFEILPVSIVDENLEQQTLFDTENAVILNGTVTETAPLKANLNRLEKEKQKLKQKYKSDEAFRNKKKDYQRKRYAKPSLKKLKQSKCKQHYRKSETYRRTLLTRRKRKYRSDRLFRDKIKMKIIQKYKDDALYREKAKTKYKIDSSYRTKTKRNSAQKYKVDALYREKTKRKSTQKYKVDALCREKTKRKSAHKYKVDALYREKTKRKSAHKYKVDALYREKTKRKSAHKYKADALFREKTKKDIVQKYKDNASYREKTKRGIVQKRHLSKVSMTKMQNVTERFKKKVLEGPECICCVCHKFRFRRQVVVCREDVYQKKSKKVASMAKQCITYNFLHRCSSKCNVDCEIAKTPRNKLWICYTCHRTILKAEMPCDAYVNNLQLEDIPDDLKDLNKLERHLTALRIPFMKIVSLPKGGQYGIAGPVTGVPCSIEKTTKTLPRCEDQAKLIQVKLKRKLPFKGHYQYQFISTKKIETALKFLINNNTWYSDVKFDKTWENPLESNKVVMEKDETDDSVQDAEDSNTEDGVLHGNPLDTCLQPVDIGQEVLDQYFENIFCVAPAEGKTPVRMLQEKGNEAMSFPVQFPGGKGSFSDERPIKLSVSRYFQSRLLNADNRFSSDTNYIFYAQYLSELHQIVSSVSIALRKGHDYHNLGNLRSDSLKDSEFLKQMLKSDQGYKFLKPIRGTPPYWQGTLKDLFAMLRQMGIPTWFCSFSSADIRWDEVINTVFKQQGSTKDASELSWIEKCEILRVNPVTAVQMFANRWHLFLHEVILSDANPIGKIIDFFFRIEFQMRGSPHVHALFWVQNAPLLDRESDEEVCKFIDTYVSVELPSEENDSEMFEIVNSVQMHSKKHSVSCKKKGTECRFNFPRPPSCRVFISRPDECNAEQTLTREAALQQLQNLSHVIDTGNCENFSTESLLLSAGLTQDMFENATNRVTKKNQSS